MQQLFITLMYYYVTQDGSVLDFDVSSSGVDSKLKNIYRQYQEEFSWCFFFYFTKVNILLSSCLTDSVTRGKIHRQNLTRKFLKLLDHKR